MLRPIPHLPANPVNASRAAARMKRRLRAAPALVPLLLLGLARPADAQAKRCDLVGRDTVIAGVGMKKCLDLSSLNGQTITVPSNVTRIDNDGLSLCKSSIQTGGNADIVYVYDNSGSMKANYAWVSADKRDTAFFEGTGGCPSNNIATDSVTFQEYNSAGTGFVTRKVPRFISNTGCSATSGDPYNARGRAMRSGINRQATRAPSSTAGLMSFTGTVGNVRRPTVLNTSTNLSNVLGGINAVSSGGTNYRPPLDTSKRWLTTNVTSNPKKAIIFVSDGRHNTADNYKEVLNSTFDTNRGFSGNMPPIYGIFMGRPIPDTANLAELSRLTGGQFFLIPPQNPDSLVTVIERILNIVLLEYEPATATVANNSLSPVQNATATAPAGFILQANGSWLMRLSDIIALRGQNSNQIAVTTQFRERTSGTVENETINFTISTTGAPTSTGGIITTQFSRVCYDVSSLRFLSPDGTRPAAFTETDSNYVLRLRTGDTAFTSAVAADTSRVLRDAEAPSLARQSATADSGVFRFIGPFRVAGAAGTADGTLQSALFDTLIARWQHPRDAQDVARDTLMVRAANKQADVWFSLTEGGARTTRYEADQAVVHVVVSDQRMDPRRTYSAVITSTQLGLDRETVTLRELSPGLLVASIPVANLTKTQGDNTLQVSLGGDNLRVVYRDPVYNDSAVATAGFDQNVQEEASLRFTDASGNALAPGAVWSPANGKLYVVYEDDYAYGRVPTKAITLTLDSRRYGVLLGTDDERFNASMESGNTASRVKWTGSIDLADAYPAVDSNGKAETRYRGEATVTANTHDNVGTPQTTRVSDNLVIAYPDSNAVITWTLSDSTLVPKGSEGLIIGVRDQSPTIGSDDSVAVSVICTRSGDSVSAVIAREKSAGSFETGILVKDGASPNVGDRVLSCLSADQIVIRYVDPVFGTLTVLEINEVAKPVATPPGKTFVMQEFVTLQSATPGAVIHYTTDNSTPVPGVSPVYTGPIQLIGNTVIKAVATLPGWKQSKVMVETYTKERIASRLEILDANGNVVTGPLAGSATHVRIKLTTTQANLPSALVDATTRVGQDDEEATLTNTLFLNSSTEYWQNIPLTHNKATTAGNDTLDARSTDTLIAVWVNPFDPTDVARDTLIIKPAFVAAEVYFTATPNGPKITSYADTQTVVYITVKTSPKDPTLTYRVTVTSQELGIDDEVVTLVEATPGVFLAQVPVARGAKTPDVAGTLQVSAGVDQLTAVFTDPVYNVSYRGDAGFGQDVQESATLEFVRKDSTLLPPGEIWSPDEGKVYLRYSDDWLAGIDSLVRVRTAKLALVNRKDGNPIGTDEENVTLTLVSNTATRGVWMGSLELRDKSSSRPLNDTLEAYFRGEVTATITPHTNKGVVGGTEVSDQLVIAYPNRPADIIIRDTSGGPVDRITPRVDIIVRDQQHTKTGDNSITVTVSCASGDRLSNVKLTWNGTEYVAVPPIAKGEGTANTSDSVLTCKSTDRIVVTYPDPVYSDIKTGDVSWSDQKASKLFFASVRDSSAITSVADGVDNAFLVIVEALSPSRDKADTLDVVLTTAQGEKLTVKAVETGAMTGVFKARVEYEFTTRPPVQDDGKLTANINQDQRNNRVIVTATVPSVTVDGKPLTADLALFSAYTMVSRAYIKDETGDGRADKAYFVFDKKLARLPSSLEEVAWNTEKPGHRQKAGASMLSFLNADSNVVVADFTKSQFGANLTGIPAGAKPYGLFPSDNLFGGQLALLADSVGPVPVKAVKLPSNQTSYSVSATEKRFYPDTLDITVSEPLRTATDFSGMLRFSKGCSPYGESVPLRLAQEPQKLTDSTWKLIVDNAPGALSPLVGDCVFLETDGRYTDLPGNRPATHGVEIEGRNPELVIRDFRGFPPVAGMDPGGSGFTLVTNDSRNGGAEGRWSTQNPNGTVDVKWLPPVGVEECMRPGVTDFIKCMEGKVPSGYDAKSAPMRGMENQSITPMPVKELSAIQVITNGRYIARVSIYDNLGVHVRSFVQAFGYWGEDKNPWRAADKGLRSFLVWDMKDKDLNKVGQGVYVWKVHFSFSDKKSEVMYTRTGVMRN